MKRLKMGPELKLSSLKLSEAKVPPFVNDLYWDLRDRRLLPLVALVIVAIVAVPFLLGGKSGQGSSPGTLAASPPAAAGSGAEGPKLVAVEAKPGLRNYHERLLSHRSPTDPFKQRYTAPQTAGAQLGGGEASSTSTTTTTQTSSSSSSGSSTTIHTETTHPSGSGAPAPGELRLYTTAADIKVVRSETKPDGKVVHDEPVVRHRVLPPAPVPSEKTAAVVYMGMDKNRLPLLLVSDAVTGAFGEGKCLAGTSTCQLLEVEPGMPETFVYGQGGKVRYKITILHTEPVLAGKYPSKPE
jgi:hypothetical protein